MAAALVLGGVALRVTGPVPGARHHRLRPLRAGDAVQHPLAHRRRRRPAGAAAVDSSRATSRYAYLCIGVLGLALALRLAAHVVHGPGRAIQALRDDERVAASWGINVTGYKLAGLRHLRRPRRHRRRAVRLDRADRVEGGLRAQPVDHVPADDRGRRRRQPLGRGAGRRPVRRAADAARPGPRELPLLPVHRARRPRGSRRSARCSCSSRSDVPRAASPSSRARCCAGSAADRSRRDPDACIATQGGGMGARP